MKKLWTLFWEMFKIALFVVGGGFAILAVADDVFAKKLKWTENGEIAMHLPVFQMVPGIIAGATAVYVGRKVAGIPGAVAAVCGVFLPSVIVFSAVSAGYAMIPFGNRFLDAAFLGLRAALSGIIAAMIVKSWKKCIAGSVPMFILVFAVVAIGVLKVNPALVVAVAAGFGVALKFAQTGGVSPGAGGVSPGTGGVSPRKFRASVWALPLVFMKYGSIAFGGGYVLVPVYIADFVGKAAPFLQLSGREFADVMALTQMTPGPIAVNCATFFGYRMGLESFGNLAGALGCAVAATVCLLLPGTVLLYIALNSLEKFKTSRIVQGLLSGVKPVTVAMMLNALWAFLSMSAWTVSEGGAVCWHPVAAALAAACAAATLSGRVGVVKQIFASAAISAALA